MGQASVMLLKDVGKPIAVVKLHQEDAKTHVTGDLILEYEIPLNVKYEKLSDKSIALSLLDDGEFIGFHF